MGVKNEVGHVELIEQVCDGGVEDRFIHVTSYHHLIPSVYPGFESEPEVLTEGCAGISVIILVLKPVLVLCPH